MKELLAIIIPVLFGLASVSAQRRMIVVDADLKVPVRDVQVYTPEGLDTLTAWDGTFAVPDSFSCLNFRHPHFEQRYILPSELRGDTIWLLPVSNVLGEVIIWGRRRFDERMQNILKPSPEQALLDQLPQAVMCWHWQAGSTRRPSVKPSKSAPVARNTRKPCARRKKNISANGICSNLNYLKVYSV